MDMTKRRDAMPPEAVQAGNKAWWTRNTMSYDWNDKVGLVRFSEAWFDEIDARFDHGSRLFATRKRAFDLLIPFEALRGKRVLEIGCGMGYHTELLIRAGAEVTAIDLSPTSVEATTARLALRGLEATVLEGDAEKLPFNDQQFAFVWSWGVIHHSSRTGRIVREIARVLMPGGECRVMVYNRLSGALRATFFREHFLKGGFLRQSVEESLYRTADGFSARFFVAEQFEDLFRTFFTDVSSVVCGQDSDVVPLPGPIRRIILRCISETYLRKQQAAVGSFIFLTAKDPD